MSDDSPNRIPPASSRQKLEAAVTKVGRAYDELVRTVEKNGAFITAEDLGKVFAFLGEVHQGSHNKAQLSLSTAIAANGGFSLDAYEPKSQMTYPAGMPQVNAKPQPAPGSMVGDYVVSASGAPEGRLIGTSRRRNRTAPPITDFHDEQEAPADDDSALIDDE